jgi:hypothetical protein
MLMHLPGFNFGDLVFVDWFHIFQLGGIKRQLEMTFAVMSTEAFKVVGTIMKQDEVSLWIFYCFVSLLCSFPRGYLSLPVIE